MTNSYNGWPGIPAGQTSRLTTIEPVPGRKFRVLAGDVAVIFGWLIRRYHNEVEPIDTGVLDDWSYNYRTVREGSSLSNHASGTAVDLNATRHPFKRSASQSMTPAQIARCRAIIEDTKVDGRPVMRWIEVGDPMHWEVNYAARGGTPEAVATLAARIRGAGAPVPTVPPLVSTTPAPVEPLEPRPVDWTNPDDALVRITQEIVGVRVDGERGSKTRAATLAQQKRLGVRNPDSMFGPAHAEAYLLSVPNLYRAKPDEKMPAPAIKLLHWIAGLPIDDSFGPGLEAAVKGMQTWAGLYPDGQVGPDTKRHITR